MTLNSRPLNDVKNVFLALLLPAFIVCGQAENLWDKFFVQVCPRMFSVEVPGNMETSEWMSNTGWKWKQLEHYLPVMTDTSKWETVLSQTDSLKFYIDGITEQCDDAYRKALADMIQETGLEVCVELGGFRMNDGIKKYGDQAGEQAALFEQKKLEVWLKTPGARLDTITTDHSMMWFIREMTPEQMELLVQEHLDYIEAMQKWRPGLKVGFIESLGYFWFKGRNGKQYKQGDVGFPRFDFEPFMTKLMKEAKRRGIEIDHFDIDHGFWGATLDTVGFDRSMEWREAEEIDYGRFLEAERICRKLGLKVGVIFNDTVWDRLYFEKGGCKTPEDADRECALRSVEFIKGYFAAGGRPDRLCFQGWTTHPTKTGPESESDSFMGMVRRQLDVVNNKYSPNTEKDLPNILLILVDDMNWDSPGFAGGVMPDATPHLDRLASKSRYFTKAHVTVAVCQPSRQSMMTGLYPPKNGALGFSPIDAGIPTLSGLLSDHGYFNAVYGKIGHMQPVSQFRWDMVDGDLDKRNTLALGRDPDFAYHCTKEFIRKAKAVGKPFFINANAADPHRPFAGSNDEKNRFKHLLNDYPDPSKVYKPGEVPPPGFLPDLPEIRTGMALYASSVRRADDVVGATLRALKESGEEDNTIVIFLSDNGMPFVFGKWDVYGSSTLTPLLVSWPAKVKPGRDDEHFVSAIDLMPTLLEIAGAQVPENLDGRSLLPLLQDQPVDDWRDVLVTAHYEAVLYDFGVEMLAKQQNKPLEQFQKEYMEKGWVMRENGGGTMDLPINKRAIHMDDFVYIYNPWVIHDMDNRGESGEALHAMRAAAKEDEAIKERLEFYLNRVPEELYDESKDPHCLDNLIDKPEYAPRLKTARRRMQEWMDANEDPNADEFRNFLNGSLKSKR
jgi:N-sulfoglucosamine sulfohydrolase